MGEWAGGSDDPHPALTARAANKLVVCHTKWNRVLLKPNGSHKSPSIRDARVHYRDLTCFISVHTCSLLTNSHNAADDCLTFDVLLCRPIAFLCSRLSLFKNTKLTSLHVYVPFWSKLMTCQIDCCNIVIRIQLKIVVKDKPYLQRNKLKV